MARRGSNIYKRKDGRWEARYVKSVAPDGTKKYASVYAASYREARQRQLQCMQYTHLSAPDQPDLSMEQLMWNWLSSISNQVKHSSYLKYESMVRNHLTSGIGKLPARAVTGGIIDQFTNEKLHSASPLSPKSINDLLVIIGMAFGYAQEEYGIPKPTIRRVKENNQEMRVLSRQEQQVLETYLMRDTDLYKLGVLLALYTGLRIGELCALHWEDIQDGNVTVSKSLHRIRKGDTTRVEMSSPKTRSSIRVIPLPPFLIPVLERRRSSGPVLRTPAGKPVEPRLMQHHFSRYIAACQLEKTNFHALRHTFATRCVEAGFDVKTLSEILGHTDVKTTLNRYVHSSYEQKKRNMEKLQAFTVI